MLAPQCSTFPLVLRNCGCSSVLYSLQRYKSAVSFCPCRFAGVHCTKDTCSVAVHSTTLFLVVWINHQSVVIIHVYSRFVVCKAVCSDFCKPSAIHRYAWFSNALSVPKGDRMREYGVIDSRSCPWWLSDWNLSSNPHLCLASFPRLACVYLLFAFTIIHRSGRLVKNGEGLGEFITWVEARWT